MRLWEAEHRWVPVRIDPDPRFVWVGCRDCPGDHQFRQRKDTHLMGSSKTDTTVSTCPRCGNYQCSCVKFHTEAGEVHAHH